MDADLRDLALHFPDIPGCQDRMRCAVQLTCKETLRHIFRGLRVRIAD